MSWPGGYSGGGQIFPQANQMQHNSARQLQILQMQAQLHQKMQFQKQQFIDRSKNASCNSPSKDNAGNSDKNVKITPVTSTDKNKIAMEGKDNAVKKSSQSNLSDPVNPSQTGNKNNVVQAPPSSITNDAADMEASIQPLIKAEPPSPQIQRLGNIKNSLLGNPPALMPNPPTLLTQESKDDKLHFSKDFPQQNQQQPYSSNVQSNRPGTERQNQSNDFQHGTGRAVSRWQSQQSSTQSGSQNDWQKQEDKKYNAQHESLSSLDYSKNSGGSYQDNASYNRQGRNMNVPYDRQSKNAAPYVKREPKGNYGYVSFK